MSDYKQSERNQLFAKALDQRLEPDEAARLEQILSEDESARKQYVQHTLLQSFIEQEVQSTVLEAEVREMLCGIPAAVENLNETEGERLANRPARWFRSWLGLATISAVTVCLVLVAVFWQSILPFNNGGNLPDNYAAMVTEVEHCRWGDSQAELHEDDILYSKQSVHLAEGVIRLCFQSGTEIAVEGPANFILLGSNSMMLKRGQLIAKVYKGGVGFTVRTPDAEVIDLGTRFGLNVEPDGTTEAHVFEGEIEMKSHGEMVETPAGVAVRVENGEFTIEDALPEKFSSMAKSGSIEIGHRVHDPNIDLQLKPTPIVWGPEKDLNGPEDIFKEGKLVRAINSREFHLIINNVYFNFGVPLQGRGKTNLSGKGTGDKNLDLMISSYSYAKSPSAFYIEGLEVGAKYKIQLILADPRIVRDGDRIIYGDDCDPENTITLKNRSKDPDQPPFGQYVIGEFTAGDTTARLTIRTVEPLRKVAFLTGYILRRVDQ